MIVGAYQFRGSNDIAKNYRRIYEGVLQASKENVRLLCFQECALTGYPPLEVALDEIDFQLVEAYLEKIKNLAQQFNMYILVGSVTKREEKIYNSMLVYTPKGEMLSPYDKRALWGWDRVNFKMGTFNGVYAIDGLKVGIRICFEVGFSDLFEDLGKEKIDLCILSFCDVKQEESLERFEVGKERIQTRAKENTIDILSVNDTCGYQMAPTAFIDACGNVVCESRRGVEGLMVHNKALIEERLVR